jgi:hypothetical protein
MYSDADGNVSTNTRPDGQYELFTHVEKTVRTNLKKFILSTEPFTGDSLLAGAASLALCYIQRYTFKIFNLFTLLL